MPIKTSGTIWMSDLHAEFGRGYWLSSYYRQHLGNNPENHQIPWADPGYPIWMSQFYGAYKSYPGAWGPDAPGYHEIWVPSHAWLRTRAWGAGGGGA